MALRHASAVIKISRGNVDSALLSRPTSVYAKLTFWHYFHPPYPQYARYLRPLPPRRPPPPTQSPRLDTLYRITGSIWHPSSVRRDSSAWLLRAGGTGEPKRREPRPRIRTESLGTSIASRSARASSIAAISRGQRATRPSLRLCARRHRQFGRSRSDGRERADG
jgi:hypothetical protein